MRVEGGCQAVEGLYCVGDSCFPGQGVIAVAFSGIMCGHRVAADLGERLLGCLVRAERAESNQSGDLYQRPWVQKEGE